LTCYVLQKEKMPAGAAPGHGLSEPDRESRWRIYVERVCARDTSALARLYDESSPALYGLALRILRNKADAEEILLDVLEQVWRTAASFESARGSVFGWLALLTRSRALDRLRTVDNKRALRQQSLAAVFEVSSPDPLPDQRTASMERQRLIREALSGLPGEQRQALELAFFSGLTHHEISIALGTPLGTIKTRIRAAMDKLRLTLLPLSTDAR
jgi:RNA polymerase sigma-70 factor, ECF subfamily